jgi:hypothetical protein
MPTVEEVLRDSGFTPEQIAQIDQRQITAFSSVLSEADKTRAEAKAAQDAAELAQRSNIDFYDNRIQPSLLAWEEEKQRIENDKARVAAEAAYYRTQNEEAKKAGFIPTEAPGFDASRFVPPNPGVQPRDQGGRYVANAPGGTPGSPTYFDVNKIYEKAGEAAVLISEINWEHEQLFGKPLPIPPSALIAQADAQKLDPKAYAARLFNYDARRQQIAQEADKARADKIAAEAVAPWQQKVDDALAQGKKDLEENNRKWAEKVGSNPDIHVPHENPKTADIARAVANKDIPDPLTLNDQQRRALTSQMIRKDMAEALV